MNPTVVVDLTREAMQMVLMLSAPPLLAALLVGVLIALFQAVTQVQEQSLTFAPKLFVMAIVIMVMMPWSLRMLAEYTKEVLLRLPHLVP